MEDAQQQLSSLSQCLPLPLAGPSREVRGTPHLIDSIPFISIYLSIMLLSLSVVVVAGSTWQCWAREAPQSRLSSWGQQSRRIQLRTKKTFQLRTKKTVQLRTKLLQRMPDQAGLAEPIRLQNMSIIQFTTIPLINQSYKTFLTFQGASRAA